MYFTTTLNRFSITQRLFQLIQVINQTFWLFRGRRSIISYNLASVSDTRWRRRHRCRGRCVRGGFRRCAERAFKVRNHYLPIHTYLLTAVFPIKNFLIMVKLSIVEASLCRAGWNLGWSGLGVFTEEQNCRDGVECNREECHDLK